MKRWTLILIAIIIILLILILIFNNYDATPQASQYSQMEIQMRKLWY
ncbi:hypothetical protein [uncultured Methanobrevibacter sp.]|nr:hypothetical protein [uncultured Methanobrevibacter sp.]